MPESTAEASKDVADIDPLLDDHRLYAEYGYLSMRTADTIPVESTLRLEASADCRFKDDPRELRVAVNGPSREGIERQFREAFGAQHGEAPDRPVEIIRLHLKRIAR